MSPWGVLVTLHLLLLGCKTDKSLMCMCCTGMVCKDGSVWVVLNGDGSVCKVFEESNWSSTIFCFTLFTLMELSLSGCLFLSREPLRLPSSSRVAVRSRDLSLRGKSFVVSTCWLPCFFFLSSFSFQCRFGRCSSFSLLVARLWKDTGEDVERSEG